MMLGFKPGPYFRACWMVLSPATMMVTAQLELLENPGGAWVTSQCDKLLCWHLLPQRPSFCWEVPIISRRFLSMRPLG